MEQAIQLVLQYLLDKGGAWALVIIGMGFLVYLLIRALLKLVEKNDQLLGKIEALQDARLAEVKGFSELRIEDGKEVVAILERTNLVQADNTRAMEKRTTSLDTHTVALEKVVVRIENLEDLVRQRHT